MDNGFTHNFVVESIVKEHKLPVDTVPTLSVQIGNRDIIHCNKVYRNGHQGLPRVEKGGGFVT